jgi:DNA polymerase-3 subunit delta'
MSEIYRWQQGIWSKLMRSRQFLGHALLLKGKQGIGKYDFARQLAKSLLCTAPTVDHEACGKCLSCGWFEHDSHPNFYSVMPEALDVMSGEDTEKKEGKEKSASATAKKSARAGWCQQCRFAQYPLNPNRDSDFLASRDSSFSNGFNKDSNAAKV